MSSVSRNLYLALVHYPVMNRNGEIVVSSVTNLDLHDIARAGRTYDIGAYFVIHPSEDQQTLNRRIIQHWGGAFGYDANPTRKEALDLIYLMKSIEETIDKVELLSGKRPKLYGTSAKPQSVKQQSLDEFRKALEVDPGLLLFGTGYGLAPSWLDRVEGFLPPIIGGSDYNHLSVRSAVSIYLDRLFGV